MIPQRKGSMQPKTLHNLSVMLHDSYNLQINSYKNITLNVNVPKQNEYE